MDPVAKFLDDVKHKARPEGYFRGLLHLLIGRTITTLDGTVVSSGQTWRDAAALLKKARWDRNAIDELGIDSDSLPPRDREKYWYTVILRVGVDSPEARREADLLAARLKHAGYLIGPPPPNAEPV